MKKLAITVFAVSFVNFLTHAQIVGKKETKEKVNKDETKEYAVIKGADFKERRALEIDDTQTLSSKEYAIPNDSIIAERRKINTLKNENFESKEYNSRKRIDDNRKMSKE